jgi:ankyrin repeat protein
VIYGHVEVALELIERGADVRARDPQKFDALMNAAASNSMKDAGAAKVAAAMLERGVSPKTRRGDYAKYTPLEIANNRRKKKLADILRKYGATK